MGRGMTGTSFTSEGARAAGEQIGIDWATSAFVMLSSSTCTMFSSVCKNATAMGPMKMPIGPRA